MGQVLAPQDPGFKLSTGFGRIYEARQDLGLKLSTDFCRVYEAKERNNA